MRIYFNQTDFKDVMLEGVSLEEVEKWIKIAKLDPKTDTYTKVDENGKIKTYSGQGIIYLQKENPIKKE